MTDVKTGLFLQSLFLSVLVIGSFSTGYMYNDLNQEINLDVETPKDNYTVENNVQNRFQPDITNEVSESNSDNLIQNRGYNLDYSTSQGVSVSSVDKVFTLNGFSMQPSIFHGNTILTKEYHGDLELRPGTIVGFKKQEKRDLTFHRVRGNYLDLERDILVTQGDNNSDFERVNESSVEYVAVGVLYT